jgi:hypothetical protein
MNWYAVRSIFHFGNKEDGKNVFEERIVVFEAENEDIAFLKAEMEANDYAKNDGKEDFKIHPDMELYIQDGDPLIDSYEVWSQLFETNENMDEFFANRYAKYEYHPD